MREGQLKSSLRSRAGHTPSYKVESMRSTTVTVTREMNGEPMHSSMASHWYQTQS